MLDIFKTKHFIVLEAIAKHEIKIGTQYCCTLSQNDIAQLLNMSRTSVNQIFSDLQTDGYLAMLGRSRWQVTPRASNFLEMVKNL